METSRTARPSAAADVARLVAGRWPLSSGMDGARALAAATGADTALGAAVALAAALPPRSPALAAAVAREDAAARAAARAPPPARGAGGARALTREYSYLISSYTAEACEPLPVFNTIRGAGVAGDAIRTAQPGIEYVLLVRDRGTTEWRTAVGNRTIPAAIAHHWA